MLLHRLTQRKQGANVLEEFVYDEVTGGFAGYSGKGRRTTMKYGSGLTNAMKYFYDSRGRVGRGEHPSFCLLVSDAPNPRQDERLTAMEQSQDGFVLAEKDLELRGPGDFLGTRQSGFAALRMAKLSDVQTIEKARREAQRLFETDPALALPEHRTIAENLARFWSPGAGDVS